MMVDCDYIIDIIISSDVGSFWDVVAAVADWLNISVDDAELLLDNCDIDEFNYRDLIAPKSL